MQEEIEKELQRIMDRADVRIVRCVDGFSMSVGASELHYCTPRGDKAPWSSVELGRLSQVEPLLWEYAESKGDWLNTVYGWVPVRLVAAIIELHGGLAVQT